MKNHLAICCKIAFVPQQREQLEITLKAFADACNYLWEYGHRNRVSQQWALHQACYRTVRKQFSLPANLSIRAIAKVATELKLPQSSYPFQPNSLLFDSRTFLLQEHDWSVGITLLNGREKFHLDIGKPQKNQLKGQGPVSAVLFRKYKSYYLEILIPAEKKSESETALPTGILTKEQPLMPAAL